MSQFFQQNIDTTLFACTKCNSRHPFEELSRRHQLCRSCKAAFKVINCDHCRTEFKIETGSKASTVCKKCELLLAQHGKPKNCLCCSLQSAFIGTRCQRCTNSEKKYGPPLNCENCKQKCAFNRPNSDTDKKFDGKLLCWICTMAYKRTQAKLQALGKDKQNNISTKIDSHALDKMRGPNAAHQSSNHKHKSPNSNTQNYGPSLHELSSSSHSTSYQKSSSSTLKSSSSSSHSSHHRSHHHHNHHNRDSSSIRTSHGGSVSGAKRVKLDTTNLTNGHQLASNSSIQTDSRFIEPNKIESPSVISQLKEQIATLNKKLAQKEKDLLSKDQQIACIKSTHNREQRELREKIISQEKQHTERLNDMHAKLVGLQRQIASQAKAPRVTQNSVFVEPPMVI